MVVVKAREMGAIREVRKVRDAVGKRRKGEKRVDAMVTEGG